ncbi:hypothetical protein RUND412_004711 [Rhizina undulata]
MPVQNITDLPPSILIEILSACDNMVDLSNLLLFNDAFSQVYDLAPTAINKSILLNQFTSKVGSPGCPGKLFDLAWRIELLTRRNAQQSHAGDQPLNPLPHATGYDLICVFNTVEVEHEHMSDSGPEVFHLAMFNSHPNGLIKLTEKEITGVFIYYSLILRLYVQEVAYYEAVYRENRQSPVVEGKEHPSRYFFDRFTYRELYFIFRCLLQSSVPLDAKSGVFLRDALERKRAAEGIEVKEEDRVLLAFTDWLYDEAKGQMAE